MAGAKSPDLMRWTLLGSSPQDQPYFRNLTEELAEALGRAESLSEHERTDIVERACRTVRTLYSTDAYVDGVYQFYRDILNENMD